MIWSPLIQNKVSFDLMHAADWVPTLYEAAGNVQSMDTKKSVCFELKL